MSFFEYLYTGTIDYCFFFFQAEDGIRDTSVTGVQTCALPISRQLLPEDGVVRDGSIPILELTRRCTEPHRHDALGMKPWRDVLQPHEAANEQPCADEQHHRDRHLDRKSVV